MKHEGMEAVVVGGGYAGIHALKAIRKHYNQSAGRRLNLVLLDPSPYHMRKVLLFKPAVGTETITVPWEKLLPEGARYVQGKARHADQTHQLLEYEDAEGKVGHTMREEAVRLELQPDESQVHLLPESGCSRKVRSKANPAIRTMGLPVTGDGRVIVDECYRQGCSRRICNWGLRVYRRSG